MGRGNTRASIVIFLASEGTDVSRASIKKANTSKILG
jgi:hypothetical protein